MALEDDHLDVLQNIEFAVLSVYKQNRNLVDTAVMRAYDTALRYIHDVRRGHTPKPVNLTGDSLLVFERVKDMCDLRMGLGAEQAKNAKLPEVSPDVIEACLRKLRKSVDRWNKQGGRQGYLKFISQFTR